MTSILKEFTTKEEIIAWLEKLNIVKYTISEDLKVSVYQDIKIRGVRGFLPVVFDVIEGNFDASFCFLVTFRNFPNKISKNLNVSHNKLKSFENCPSLIGGNIICHSNKDMNSFKGIQSEINGDLDISNCSFSNFLDFPNLIKGNLHASINKFSTLDTPEEIVIEGSADFSTNKITSENCKLLIKGNLSLSDNPVEPADDDIKENAMW